MSTKTVRPDVLDPVRWVQQLTDPDEQLIAATELGDRVRDQVMVELAAIRRSAAVLARQKRINEGMGATEATRDLAETVGQSPQTIARLLYEARGYGHGPDDD